MNNENEEIDDSLLKHLETEGGFKVPHGYFNRLKQHVLDQTTGTPIDEQSGFQIPEGYFGQSREQILLKTTGIKANPILKVWYKRPILRYAAAAAVIMTSSILFWPFQRQDASMVQINVSDEEIIQYLGQSDVHDIPVTEVSFVSSEVEAPVSVQENYIINQTDEQSIIEEL
jgi:hypothetical protein